MFRRRQRLFVEMEQMASRPVAEVRILRPSKFLSNDIARIMHTELTIHAVLACLSEFKVMSA